MKIILLLLLIVSLSALSGKVEKVEVLKDPGLYEGLVFWSKSNSGIKISHSCTQRKSVCVSARNENVGDYSYFAQKVNASYGDIIHVDFSMKGNDITGGDYGAGSYIKAYDSLGNVVDTYISQGESASFDWKKINYEYTVPRGVKNLTVGFHVGRGNTGAATFDNLSVVKYIVNNNTTSPVNVSSKSDNIALNSGNNFFDSDGYLLKHGKRFFPLGLFVTNSNAADYKIISEAGFNTILSYSIPSPDKVDDFFSQTSNNGLYVIFSLKDMYQGMKWAPKFSSDSSKLIDYIDSIKVKDNLLAWYINDELPVSRISEVKALFSTVRGRDLMHPILQVVYRTAIARFFLEYSDIIAADVYPVGVRKDLSITYEMASELDDMVTANKHIKTSWFIPQIMDWGVYREKLAPHPPSYNEMKNQAYQALIAGSKGLIFYSYYDLYYSGYPRKNKSDKVFYSRWNDVVKMTREINAILPSILTGHEYVDFKAPYKADTKIAMYSNANVVTVLLANPFYIQKSIDIVFPDNIELSSVNAGELQTRVQGNKLSIVVPPLFSGSFILKVK